LKGVFDVFDAMTGLTFSFNTGNVTPLDSASLASMLPARPVVVRGRLKTGGGAAVLLSLADAARLAALIDGKEEMAASADEQAVLAVVREIAVPCMGAGFTNLMEKAGNTPDPPEGETADLLAPEKAGSLLEFFGKPPKAVAFDFSAGTLQASATLLLGPELEGLMEAETPVAATAAVPETPQPALSETEVTDILSKFDKPPQPARQNGNGAQAPAPPRAPSNIDMVLDIRLVATARLGRVEMPIGDILALGPGSIIDVGRLVDEPVELLVNNKLIARGDVVVVDEKFGLRITEIISPKERIESMH
jgi:flagellar motor switch protein FliN/FliY